MPGPSLGERFSIVFTLCLEDGTEVDASGEEPWCFSLGDGSLVDGLEGLVAGLDRGERQRFVVAPEHAFGLRDEALLFPVPLAGFARAEDAEPGNVVAFETPTGEQTPGRVVSVDGGEVLVDFNHPLAGQTVVFDVQLISRAPPETLSGDMP